jgi:hypothetical protein
MKKFFCCLIFAFSLLLTEHVLALDIKNIEKKLEQHQKQLPKGDIKQITYIKRVIDYMYEFDQELRNLFIKHQSDEQLRKLLKNLDVFHTAHMKEILKVHGWIVISKFGSEYDRKAWLIIQHADEDPFFQAGVLFLLEKLANRGETDRKNYAYLYDRVAPKFNQIGLLQKYGTQVNLTKDIIKLQPHEGDIKDIDKNRKEFGLEPLADYLKQIKEIYKL